MDFSTRSIHFIYINSDVSEGDVISFFRWTGYEDILGLASRVVPHRFEPMYE
jgi:hypothetical protein